MSSHLPSLISTERKGTKTTNKCQFFAVWRSTCWGGNYGEREAGVCVQQCGRKPCVQMCTTPSTMENKKKKIQPQSYGFKENELLCISGKGSGLSTNILWKQINSVSADFLNTLPPNFARWGGREATFLIPVLSVLLFSNIIRSPSLLKNRLFMQPSSVAIWKATVF